MAHSLPRFAAAALLLGLAACAESGPAPTTGASGSASPPMQQRVDQMPHSAPVSAGTPAITGSTGARPEITRSGPGTGDLSTGTPTMPRARGSRGN
jgi:hypothetical protein